MRSKSMFCKEYFWQILVTIGGLFVIFVTLLIGAFLVYKGSDTFLKFHHTLQEFLGSANFAPMDNASSKGHVGALIFIVGSLCVEIFAGIPSVVYGWVGLTVLIPFLKKIFNLQVGHSILAASLVLSIMIFPSITSVASDAIRAVSKETRMAAYGLGSTRWQTIYRVVIPAAFPGIISGIVLGLARAFGEALAVAMVIGQTTALPKSIFSTSKTLTTEIAAQMGNAMEGGEMKAALWTMALLLFLISLLFITIIHKFSKPKGE